MEKGIEDYFQALLLNLNDAEAAYIKRGEASLDKKNYDKAVEDFTHAIPMSTS